MRNISSLIVVLVIIVIMVISGFIQMGDGRDFERNEKIGAMIPQACMFVFSSSRRLCIILSLSVQDTLSGFQRHR